MQSLVLTHDGLQIADTPLPPLMPGHVRIEVRSVGICSLDLAIWKGNVEAEMPIILGHEISGVVHESSLPEFRPATHVAIEADQHCGTCWFCRRGRKNVCLQKKTLGIDLDGGMTEYLTVPVDSVFPLPEGIDDNAGTFIEPLAAAIQTYETTPSQPDEAVVVIGSGKLGLLIAQVYDAYGADVHVVGKNKWQLGLARQLGLRNTHNIKESNWRQSVLNATAGVGSRIVVEATGSPTGFDMATEIVRSEGVVAIKSTHGSKHGVDLNEIVQRGLRIQGTTGGSFSKAIDLLSKGRIEVKRLISGQFGLEQGAEAFRFADRPENTKVIVNV
ncbi:MAG: alcohol dehydrogenase catalytic domain-containing protein [Candidatus Thorarchaeota archaeon]|nr:MAG: alcohol dehydrogenase catalytic domain-containing protein [Candidatus Thorarchaeota archaeon]